MESRDSSSAAALRRDRSAWALFGGVTLLAFIFTQGLPLWDDDFTSWFWKIKDRSIPGLLWDWISPVSSQPQYWGFNERALQALAYKVGHLVSGYEGWSYFLYKSLIYGAFAVAMYAWCLRATEGVVRGRLIATAVAVFVVLAPGPMAAHVLHSDFATTAELLFLVLMYLLWDAVERVPTDWKGWPSLKNPVERRLVLRWLALSIAVYLSYESKADLKMIPGIIALYLVCLPERRRQWRWFLAPIALMLLLAVPWGPGLFKKLPAFVPGAPPSEVEWMWQPLSVKRLISFLWSSEAWSLREVATRPTLSLAAVLGPFLLAPLVAFLLWRAEALDKVPWTRVTTRVDRVRVFALVWFGVVLVGVSALPELNYIFRVRYGIIPIIPAAILVAWALGLVASSLAPEAPRKLPAWLGWVAVALFVTQTAQTFNRSVVYRREMGQMMLLTEEGYSYLNEKHPNGSLRLVNFRSYDYRPDANAVIHQRGTLERFEDLEKEPPAPGGLFTISWTASLWEQVDLVKYVGGCLERNLFDWLIPCPPASGVYLYRHIGRNPLYFEGEKYRLAGDNEKAMEAHGRFLAMHPLSFAGNFVYGLEAFSLRRWVEAERAWGYLSVYFPEHLGIAYNHGLALKELGRFKEALERLEVVLRKEPNNFSAMYNAFLVHRAAGDRTRADISYARLKGLFPNHPDVKAIQR